MTDQIEARDTIPAEEHYRRVTELLEANNREVERRRADVAKYQACADVLQDIIYGQGLRGATTWVQGKRALEMVGITSAKE